MNPTVYKIALLIRPEIHVHSVPPCERCGATGDARNVMKNGEEVCRACHGTGSRQVRVEVSFVGIPKDTPIPE